MIIDGITLAEGSAISNLTVDIGPDFPTVPDIGELFLKLDNGEYNMYIYHTGTWNRVADEKSITDTLGFNPVNKAGDTLTGPLILSGLPTQPLHATTKSYVDSAISGSSASYTINGDVTGTISAGTSSLTLVNSGVTAGNYKAVNVDLKGRVISGSNPTTLSGFGITDAQTLSSDLTAIAALVGTTGTLKKTGVGTWTLDTAEGSSAADVTVTNDIATASVVYPVWVSASTGNLPIKLSNTKISFVPSTGILTTVGLISGSLQTAGVTGATNGNNLTIAPGSSVTGTAANVNITGAQATGGAVAGNINITGGQATGTTSQGGALALVGGNGTQQGGSITISGGQSSTSSGTPGSITIQGGAQLNAGATGVGIARINGGFTNVSGITAGAAVISGGQSSSSTGIGGPIYIDGGMGGVSGSGGEIIVRCALTNTLIETFRIKKSGAWSLGSSGTSTGSPGQVMVSGGSTISPTWSSTPVLQSLVLTGAMETLVDKGTVGTGTVTFNFSAGNVQRLQVSGPLTITASNWPASGTRGYLTFKLVNAGSAVVTITPTINWVKPDGTTTTSIATYMTAISRTGLQASGTDHMIWWTDDAGTTIYGKMI